MIKYLSKKRIIIVICVVLLLVPVALVAGDYYRQVKLRSSVERILSVAKTTTNSDVKIKDASGCKELPVGYTSSTACYRGFDLRVDAVSRDELESQVSRLHSVISKELSVEYDLELGTVRNKNRGSANYVNKYSASGLCGLSYWFGETEKYGIIHFSCNDTTELSKLFNLWGIRQKI